MSRRNRHLANAITGESGGDTAVAEAPAAEPAALAMEALATEAADAGAEPAAATPAPAASAPAPPPSEQAPVVVETRAITPLDAFLIDAGLGPMHITSRRQSTGRRPATTTERVFGLLADGRAVTAKIFPVAWPFDLSEAVRIQNRFREAGVFRVPAILAQGRISGQAVIVEEEMVGARSLSDLVAAGEVTVAEAGAVIAKAINAAQHLPTRSETRCVQERHRLFAALDRAPIPQRHRLRIASWLETNYDLVSHAPVDAHGDCIPDNLLRVPGDDQWCLIDFDLASTTSLLWQSHLRIARMTMWELPGWDDAWGHANSLTIAFLSRLLEWDLQSTVMEDAFRATEWAVAIAVAAERWADLLGPAARQAPSPTQPLITTPADGAQIYWLVNGIWSEEGTVRGLWPADGLVRSIVLEPSVPVSGVLRIDPAAGPCVVHLDLIEVAHEPGVWLPVSWDRLRSAVDTLLIADAQSGRWCLCLGPDPQVLLADDGRPIVGLRLHGTKSSGIDPAIADWLVREGIVALDLVAPLVRTTEQQDRRLVADLKGDIRDLQARLGARNDLPASGTTATTGHADGTAQAEQLAELARLLHKAERIEADLGGALTAARQAGEQWAARLVETRAALEARTREAESLRADAQRAGQLVETTARDRQELDHLRQRLDEAHRALAAAQADRDAVEDALTGQQLRAERLESDLAAVRAATAQVEGRLQAATAAHDEAARQSATATGQSEELRRGLATAQAEAQQRLTESTALRSDAQRLAESADQARTAAQEAQGRLAAQSAELSTLGRHTAAAEANLAQIRQQLAAAEARSASLDNDRSTLGSRVASVEGRSAELQQQLAAATASAAALEHDRATLSARVAASEASREELQQQLAAIAARNGALDADRNSYVEQLAGAQARHEELQRQLSEVQAHNGSLAAEREALIARQAAAEAGREQLQQQLASAEARRAGLDAERSSLLSQVAALQNGLEGMRRQLADTSARAATLDNERIALLEKLAASDNALEQQRQSANELQGRLHQADNAVGDLRSRLAVTEAAQTDQQRLFAHAEARAVGLEGERSQLELRLASSDQERISLARSVADLQAARDQLDLQLAAARTDATRWSSELDSARTVAHATKARLDQLGVERDDLRQRLATAESGQRSLMQNVAEAAAIRTRLDEALIAARADATRLAAELEASRISAHGALARADQLDVERSDLQQRLARAEGSAAEAMRRLDATSNRLEHRDQQVADLQADLAAAEAVREHVRSEAAKAESSVVALLTEANRATARIASLEATLSELTGRLATAQSTIQRQEHALADASQRATAAETGLASSSRAEALAAATGVQQARTINELQTRLGQIQADKDHLTSALAAAESRLPPLQAHRDDLRAQVTAHESTVRDLRQDLTRMRDEGVRLEVAQAELRTRGLRLETDLAAALTQNQAQETRQRETAATLALTVNRRDELARQVAVHEAELAQLRPLAAKEARLESDLAAALTQNQALETRQRETAASLALAASGRDDLARQVAIHEAELARVRLLAEEGAKASRQLDLVRQNWLGRYLIYRRKA